MLQGVAERLNRYARRVAHLDRAFERRLWLLARRFPIGRPDFSWKAFGRPDYSWKNLAAHRVGACTLEEYWRRDPTSGAQRNDAQMGAELVQSADGVVWHVAHLPLRWKGQPEKEAWSDARWADLEAIIDARLDIARATKTDRETNASTSGADERALFDGVTLRFLQKQETLGRVLHISCANATFRNSAFLDGARFGPSVWFVGTQFLGTADLKSAQFEDAANFDDCYFLKHACFENASITGQATLRRTIFREGASFFNTQFHERTRFSRAKFHSAADFCKAHFHAPVHISGAQFFHTCSFPDAQFIKGSKIKSVRFRGAADLKRANFEISASFRNCSFDAPAEFEDAKLPTDSTFDMARFGVVDGVSRPAQLVAWAVFFGIVLMYCASGAPLSLGTVSLAFSPWVIWLLFGGGIVARDLDLERIARSFRTLTQHAAKFNNRKDAGRFLRQELRATRLRWNANPVERAISYLFDLTSGYGFSIARPIMALATSTVFFSILFAYWDQTDLFHSNVGREPRAYVAPVEAPDLVGGFHLSGTNVLAPFALWSPQPTRSPTCDLRGRLMGHSLAVPIPGKKLTLCGTRWMTGIKPAQLSSHVLRVQIASGAQSLLSIFLLFATGLALRRRYQVT
jgi:hypothetical protein